MDKKILALVNNEPEALMRVAGLIRRKGGTMKKICMEAASDASYARLTITIGYSGEMEHIISQIEKFINVHTVEEIFEAVDVKSAAN